MIECPSCDRDDFKSERGMKSHHTTIHNERLSAETTNCDSCGDEYEYLPANGNGVYCSWDCRVNNDKKDTRVCQVCENEVTRYKTDFKDMVFCSRECYAEYCSRQTGEDANQWKGGLSSGIKFTNSSEGEQWRRAVFERDDYTCQDCGERGGNLNSHHIKPRSEYPELETEVSNGVTLCIDCHANRHEEKGENQVARLIRQQDD